MKIGADGLLLGAIAECALPTKILDIGTGCGLIALMLQQKYQSAAITAIEPNQLAFHEAKGNFSACAFAQKPTALLSTLQDFKTDALFDLIVSNPPFFSEEVSSGNVDRDMARQARFLPLNILIEKTAELLAQNGTCFIVYPIQYLNQIISLANQHQIFACEIITLLPNETAPAKRVIVKLSKNKTRLVETTFQIEEERNVYTQQYLSITKDYHLNF